MSLDAYAAAAERHGAPPKFGALATAPTPSMKTQVDGAIEAARAEAREMSNLARVAADAHRAIPNLSRSAEIITGGASASFTLQNMAGAVVESALRASAAPLNRSVDDAGRAGEWVFGEFTDKIDNAKGVFREFSKEYAAYTEVNRQYQDALRSQDYAAISGLAARKNELVAKCQQSVNQLQNAVRALGREDARFEKATVQAAEHVLLAAAGVGRSQASFTPSDAGGIRALAADLKHHLPHLAQETAVGQVWHRVFGDHD